MKRIWFAAMFLAIKGVEPVSEADDRGATISNLLTNALFHDIVVSLSATIGLYVVCHSSMYVACLGPLMDINYHAQLTGPVAHRHLVRLVHAPRTVIDQHPERLRWECHVCPPGSLWFISR